MAFLVGETSNSLSTLPPFQALTNQPATEKATIALQFLREVAIAQRQSQRQKFYSIRAVAKHFSLPTSRVTRLYSQLKTEGILSSIWGSKTIIEPTQLDNDIRLKGIVALPMPLHAFSVTSSYKLFARSMQGALWKERFGSKIVFYDETIFDGSAVTEAVLEARSDIVIWLTPLVRTAAIFSKLKDHGIKSIVIADEIAANGDAGYCLNWQNALMWGMADWKRSEIRTVVVIKGAPTDSASTMRLLYSALTKAGLDFRLHEASELRTGKDFSGPTKLGVIFISAQSLIQFAQGGLQMVERLLRYNRVLFIHGHVDLPYQAKLSCGFDTIKFEWPTISTRIVRDLIASRCNGHVEKQTIFKGKWYNGISLRPDPDRPAFAVRIAAQ